MANGAGSIGPRRANGGSGEGGGIPTFGGYPNFGYPPHWCNHCMMPWAAMPQRPLTRSLVTLLFHIPERDEGSFRRELYLDVKRRKYPRYKGYIQC